MHVCNIFLFSSLCSELSLMFGLMDRIPLGVDPMLADLENYITQSGIDDMKACAEIITTVSQLSLSLSLPLPLPYLSHISYCASTGFREIR